MTSRKSDPQHKHKKGGRGVTSAEKKTRPAAEAEAKKRLEIVLKCDTSGCVEAVAAAIVSLALPEVEISIISSGVGAVNKSDIFMAETGSRLVAGFNVGIMPHIDQLIAEHNVEIRLYDVIYNLLDDLEAIAKSQTPRQESEKIIGSAKVIALFKSSRRGAILGCEVLAGRLALGHSFRVLGAMGSMYTGTIESLHIEHDAVREAVKGQQVGLKIREFDKARIGDLVESFQAVSGPRGKTWQPQGKIFYP